MYTLYYKPGACSMAVHVLLNELNQPFTLKHFQSADGKTDPELLKINPRGQVPTIQKGNMSMREGGAILSWLCDEHNSDLLPRKGEERANALQWLMFANASMHPAYGRIFFLNRTAKDGDQKNELITLATKQIQTLWDDVEAQLGKTAFISGKNPTVADILLTVIANWSAGLPQPITFGQKTKAMFSQVISRPAYQKALEAENITYKVAA